MLFLNKTKQVRFVQKNNTFLMKMASIFIKDYLFLQKTNHMK
jgi:hypothetical protein